MSAIFSFEFIPRGLDSHNEEFWNGRLEVAQFSGSEGVSELYRYEIMLVADAIEAVTPITTRLFRCRALFTVDTGLRSRQTAGIITAVSVLGVYSDKLYLKVVLEPEIALLKHNVSSATYMDKTIPDIVSEVLSIPGRGIKLDLSGITLSNYSKESFICRFNESSLDFAFRLLERAGIYWYFKQPKRVLSRGFAEQEDESDFLEVLILSDRKESEKYLALPEFTAGPSAMYKDNIIASPVFTMRRIPDVRSLTGYDLDRSRTASTLPEAHTTLPLAEGVANIMYSGRFGNIGSYSSGLSVDVATKNVRREAERDAVLSAVLEGQTGSAGLECGRLFLLKGAAYLPEHSFMTIKAIHNGRQAGFLHNESGRDEVSTAENFYTCKFEAIPSTAQYRPMLKTPSPKIGGFLPAIVEGKSNGSQAGMDSLGRYRIKFGFDHSGRGDGQNSAWVKLMEPFGGTDGSTGIHFPLLCGSQVMVGFVDGNPDMPFIAGTLQDGSGSIVNSTCGYCNVIRTASGNLLIMADKADGSEYILSKNSTGYQSWGEPDGDILDKF